MEIQYEVEDGYAGGSRPRSFRIDDSEIEACDSVEDALEQIELYTQDDFADKISWYYSRYDSMVEQVKEIIGGA